MPAKRKVFVNRRAEVLPSAWAEHLGITHYARQGHLAVLAASKREAVAVLADRLGQRAADVLEDGLRVASADSVAADALLAAGLFALDGRSPAVVLTWHQSYSNKPIAAVEGDGTVHTVAHWQYDADSRSLRVVVEASAVEAQRVDRWLARLDTMTTAEAARREVFWLVDVEDVPVAKVREFTAASIVTEATKPHADAQRIAVMAAALGMVAEIEKHADDGSY